jgi:hypothetical protein
VHGDGGRHGRPDGDPVQRELPVPGWSGDTTCTNQNPCNVDMVAARWVRAKFTPVAVNGNVCQAMGW